MATIQDIADEVGISKAAVSRILNKKGSFSRDTIEKVERAARRLNYSSMNMLVAAREAQKESDSERKLIGYAGPPDFAPYYAIQAGLAEAAVWQYGYELVNLTSSYQNLPQAEFESLIAGLGIKGLLVSTFNKDLASLQSFPVPVVLVGLDAQGSLPSVSADNFAAGRLAGRYLRKKGCTEVLYVSAFPEGLKYDKRYQGFSSELESSGIQIHTLQINPIRRTQEEWDAAITEFYLQHPDIQGIFFESPRAGVRIYEIFSRMGAKIPQELTMIGFGNAYTSQYTCPRMTMIMENTNAIVEKASEMLIDQVENGDSVQMEGKIVNLPVYFQGGETG